MKIKDIIRAIMERIINKACYKCSHCIEGISCDNYKRYSNCMSSIYPKEFEPKNME